MSGREILDSYVEAWKARDPERIAGHFAADGVRRWEIVVPPVIGGPRRFQGRAQIAAPVRALITAIPDLALEAQRFAETEEGGMLEWRHFGTHTGAWNRWTPQGEPVEFSGVSVYRIAGDEIAEECIYFDPDLLVREWAVPLGALASVGIGTLREGRAIRRRRRAGG
jgi:SnoaL-like polyketide cyclase